MSFKTLGLAEPILRALADSGHAVPTPIQAAAIPPVLAGRDLVGIARTGTGKTAAFALPILARLAAAPGRPAPRAVRVLVLSPTRELAAQIAASFRTYGRHLAARTALAIGGVAVGPQARALAAGADVLVATPGRLLDLVESRAVDLSRVEVLVLDEADRMLDMGFVRDIRRIVAFLPKKRQTLLFSATMPAEIARLAADLLSDPLTVSVDREGSPAARVEQRVVHVARADKPGVLLDVLRDGAEAGRALVFTRTKHGADKVARALARAGVAADAIHGNKSQGQRERALAAFRDGRVPNLVATDIAARGIDVAGVSHVINYDLPNVPESYVHRIGRTGRAGAAGIAISLVSADELPFLRAIETLIREPIPAVSGAAAGGEAAPPAARPPRPAGARGGRPARAARAKRPPAPARRHGPARRDDDIAALDFMQPPRRGAAAAARRAG